MVDKITTLYGTFDSAQLKTLNGYISEIMECMNRQKAATQSMSDIIKIAYDELKIPKKIIKKMAKVKYNHSLEVEIAEFKEFESLFESISELT